MKSVNLDTKILVYKLDEATDEVKKLIEKAKKATETAYAPYSHFHVGAAMLLSDGTVVMGNNQENAAYPSGLCAERVALYHANSHYPDKAVEAIVVAAFNGKEFTAEPCTPCGSCRQSILELENKHEHPIRIIMYGTDEIYEVGSIKDILPLSFGKESL